MDWTAYLLFLMILLVWHIIRSGVSSKAGPASSRAADIERTRGLTALAIQKLEQSGLEDLMLTDCRFTTRIGAPKKTSLPELQSQLQSALMEMLTHLHLMPNIRLLVTDDPNKLSGPGRLGEYVHNYAEKEIRILVNQQWDAAILLAGLCHECTHYFMYSHMLNHADPDYNEGLTDTMACMIGFADVMIAGHSNRALPYLVEREFVEVKRGLTAKRQQLQNVKQAARNLETARAQLRKNLAGTREMKAQAEAVIAVKKVPSGRRIPKSRFSDLQATLLSLETGAYDEAFNRAEAAQSGDLNRVSRADIELLQICGNLYALLLAFQN